MGLTDLCYAEFPFLPMAQPVAGPRVDAPERRERGHQMDEFWGVFRHKIWLFNNVYDIYIYNGYIVDIIWFYMDLTEVFHDIFHDIFHGLMVMSTLW